MIKNQMLKKDSENELADSQQRSRKVKTVVAEADYAGQRIDNFLLRELKSVPKSHVYKILRRGEVRVNGKRIKPEYKIKEKDLIRIPPVRQRENSIDEVKSAPAFRTTDLLLKNIIYEDDKLIVLNKPSGIAAHGGSGISFGVIEAMRQARPDLYYLELVHRLDRGTSGCLLLAKKRSVLRTLHELLRLGQMHKTYVLLVNGCWDKGKNKKVEAALLKNRLSSGERVVKINETAGKEAITIFQPLQVFDKMKVSLLTAKLLTGKTHQIRVHATHLGHPLAGDDKYGDKEFNKDMHKLGLHRLFLHAAEIKFSIPDSSAPMHFKAPLPDELADILEKLK